MDDTNVNIRRNKRKLEKIRNDRQGEQQSRDNSTSAIGLFQATTGQDEGNTRQFEGVGRDTYTGDTGTEVIAPAAGRFDSGIRSSNAEGVYATQSDDRGHQQARESALTVEDAEAKSERERELSRQRVARYRERQRESNSEAPDQAQNRNSNVTGVTGIGNGGFSFNLKKGNVEPVKLLTKSEVEDAREALIYVYQKGSSLLDDLIEIVTVGHEEVSIWAMTEDEAVIFAEAHLKKAQKDLNAARSARMLLKIHDKLLLTQYVATRVVATHRHIKQSGGLSFK